MAFSEDREWRGRGDPGGLSLPVTPENYEAAAKLPLSHGREGNDRMYMEHKSQLPKILLRQRMWRK